MLCEQTGVLHNAPHALYDEVKTHLMDVPADEKLLKALAVALVDHSTGTFKDIAEAAGVSKATLNRFCGTRANLIEILLIHASELMNKMIADADLQNAPPLEALQRLIDNHLTHREMLVFLVFQWRPDTMDEKGLFRIDISAPVLTETFASLLFGLVDAERRGRVARTGMDAVLLQMFMQGARSGA